MAVLEAIERKCQMAFAGKPLKGSVRWHCRKAIERKCQMALPESHSKELSYGSAIKTL